VPPHTVPRQILSCYDADHLGQEYITQQPQQHQQQQQQKFNMKDMVKLPIQHTVPIPFIWAQIQKERSGRQW